MSQDNTYRPAVLPSEAVMMPAVDEIPETPLPAVQQEPMNADEGMNPAISREPSDMRFTRSKGSSQALERIRNRMRSVDVRQNQWMQTSEMPLDGRPVKQADAQPLQTAQQERGGSRLLAQGAALSTLMRSATRQYTPAPTLTTPLTAPIGQPAQPANHPQMRGALRQVVRNAHQSH